MSKGIITEISSVDLNGISHSIVIDDMPKSRTYLERNMEDILLDLLSEGPTEFYQRDTIRSTYMKMIDCMA